MNKENINADPGFAEAGDAKLSADAARVAHSPGVAAAFPGRCLARIEEADAPVKSTAGIAGWMHWRRWCCVRDWRWPRLLC